MKRFDGKHVLVTGGGSGIGLAMVERFVAEGATVSVFERDGGEGFEAVDVSDGAAVAAGVERIWAEEGKIDVLVNNAGIAHVGDVSETSREDVERVFGVNVMGVYHCLHEVVPRMAEAGGGVVFNVCSIAARLGIERRFAYSASKGAVLAMTLSVARDYVDKGVRCNCVCPARVRTPFVDGYLAKNHAGEEEEMLAKLSAYQPIGRMG
ncbi:MAG: SDR family NAD(P)-dependent oxidoreductase, partial [Verrucomicrobiales bacterium]|nr:SDR family NAD(P)-dependent oxidoreductase [Verrucomicrobiales bacterium]